MCFSLWIFVAFFSNLPWLHTLNSVGAGTVSAARSDTAAVTGTGTGTGLVAAGRTDTASVTGAGTGAGMVTAILVGTVTADLTGVGVGAVDLTCTVTNPGAAGWYTLLAITQEARDLARDEAVRRPSACPHCGEPLQAGPEGQLHCRFDGYRA